MFELGDREVTAAAAEALKVSGVDPESLFQRHRRGDWGSAPVWCSAANDRAASRGRASHAISSTYPIGEGVHVHVVTAMDRSRTRIQLAQEYPNLDIGARDGYAIWAEVYDEDNALVAVEEAAIGPVIDRLGKVDRVVDVGTGTGRHALRFASSGARVVALDESPEMLAVARSKGDGSGILWVRAVLGEGHLPLRTGSFDLLVSALMLTHVSDLPASVSECARVVRQGGSLLITDFHPAVRWVGWRTSFGTPDAWVSLPNEERTREEYLEAVEQAGCRIVQVRDVASDGSEYGEVSKSAVRNRGHPPLCLVIVADKR